MATKEQMLAAVKLVSAIHETITEFGQIGVASGELYAQVMQCGMSLDTYLFIIETLKQAGRVREAYHRLYAINSD